ncbi:hypothetical protein H2201_003583 [Coniosporium apollinis]|uniref:alpha-1,2-Mannosidase n=1 Tax=Coniosporium apollinis TaxID=61459 RepID=A0ABQ9NVI3_9PEZI|nr:hypothetical protein H2201_003583 [Coniosporium apollinis]
MRDEEIKSLRQETRDIFFHGYDNYMKHAFPEDELKPLTCAPLTRDRENPAHIEVNDVLGNYSLTLIDSLSTFAILASSPPPKEVRRGKNKALKEFQDGVALLVEYYGDGTEGRRGQGKKARGFDLDSKVQVFETVIRGVGGLVSAHLFAIGDLPIRGYTPAVDARYGEGAIPWKNGFVYNGQLLRLALDLATRLLPAFYTPTGLPYPRVNLRRGIYFYPNSPLNADAEHGQCGSTPPPSVEVTETCSAGAGSLVLEFSTLSRLTGDDRFEIAAKNAFWAVWERRSNAGLIGSGIDAETGQWVTPFTGIGAGIDSFFEYALKSHILLSGLPHNASNDGVDSSGQFLATWQNAHAAVKRHVYRGSVYQHPHYIQVDLYTGAMRAFWVDSLSAYYPGLLTLAGELDEAIETHLLYTALWTRYSALPERWSTATGNIEHGLRWWGGRPEFIESTWYLYRATQDPWYLHVGEMALRDIKRRCWTKCGWAGLQDVRSGEKSDRMESFFLGETAKYLFLLFDPTHPLNSLDGPFVFTTEGHPLIIPGRLRRPAKPPSESRASESFTEPAARSLFCPLPPPLLPFSVSPTAARDDVFHAASLARLHLMPSIETLDSPLVEFNADHPSISLSDLQSPSNYTYYPWTLPPEYVPSNAMSAKMATRTTFDLSFPTSPDQTFLSLGALQRVGEGILVNSMSGLKLGMIREYDASARSGSASLEDAFRIHSVSNVGLGRDEKVFMERDMVAKFNPVDPYFTRIRDMQMLDLFIDVPPLETAKEHLAAEPTLGSNKNVSDQIVILADGFELNVPMKVPDDPSLFSSIVADLRSMLADSVAAVIAPTHSPIVASPIQRMLIPGTLPTGPGAAPLPDLNDPNLAYSEDDPLPWKTIYIADEICAEKLPKHVPRDYQILVIKRGGCSFSQKLRNIPSFAPSSKSLQLVIVVSWPEHDDLSNYPSYPPDSARRREQMKQHQDSFFIQPLLEEKQLTPGGIARPNGIPMIMVGGGDETMKLLERAKGVGVRRRWFFLSQGIRIGNLIVL